MALQIGDTAPDFEAETTEGRIRFHEWLGNSWGCCFRIPRISRRSARPSSATWRELKPEFDKRGVKIIGLSVDPVDDHTRWANDIKETQGFAPNYPMIGDTDLKIAKLYGMLPASASANVEGARRPTIRRCATCSSSGRTRRSSWCSSIR